MNENRYARQLALPEVGSAGQAKLSAARVLIVGAGGLGVPALSYLVGAGIGHLRLVDDDTIALHNLHRQVLFNEAEQGQYKVAVAARKMAVLNSQVVVEPISERVVSSNIEQLIDGCDCVVDAADNFTTTYLLSDACQQLHKPLISASAAGVKGYMGVFCHGAPSYRALFPSPPDDGLSCARDGVLGPVVAVLGALQAQAAIKLLLTESNPSPSPSLATLINIDLWNNHFSSIDFSSAPEPEVAAAIAVLKADEIVPGDTLIDVREAAELHSPPLRRALHIPLANIAGRLGEISREQRVVLCCTSGRRAASAAQILASQHYPSLAILSLG
ncbi:MAG: HesA/MoeB/ThiF family protein [Gammaproteobacteria bacterium]|nr:HesA/MoeB/ThiF family protein [Gammaproteobacteria bacterium]MBQ0840577.1 HesA/MoeB/ThiF family protein [Gammaproteobacteria bacterium]